MIEVYAEGGNFRIELDAGIAHCRVWRRPDLTSAEGARLAASKIGYFKTLAAGKARCMLFDLSEAPPVTGPKTQEALGAMFNAWEKAGLPIAVVSSALALQNLQLKRLVTSHAAKHGRVFTDEKEARAWLIKVAPATKR